jgi:hypothetical protein
MTTSPRANFLPEPRLAALRPALQEHLAKISAAISPENFLSLCDPEVLHLLLSSFDRVKADEGSIWLLDAEKQSLVVSYNSGPDAEKIVGFKQPMNQGLISLVVAAEQGLAENFVFKHAKHSPLLDRKVGRTTYAMIAVPFYFLNQVRGVISCVQLVEARFEAGQTVPVGNAPGFGPEDLTVIQKAAAVVRSLIDFRLLATAVGWNRH